MVVESAETTTERKNHAGARRSAPTLQTCEPEGCEAAKQFGTNRFGQYLRRSGGQSVGHCGRLGIRTHHENGHPILAPSQLAQDFQTVDVRHVEVKNYQRR
jgi:hypothetical protein